LVAEAVQIVAQMAALVVLVEAAVLFQLLKI
jgi:hypothetical protein